MEDLFLFNSFGIIIYSLLNETLILFQTTYVYDYINKYMQFISPILGLLFIYLYLLQLCEIENLVKIFKL
jgi:hypothetical protein